MSRDQEKRPKEDGNESEDSEYEDLFFQHPHLPGFDKFRSKTSTDHHSEGPKSLQAFVLAGGSGSRMTSLVSDSRHKSLLPICNFPMVYYPLSLLQDAGFKRVVLLTAKKMVADMKKFLESSDLKLEVKIVESNDDEDLGAVDVMRLAVDEILDHIRDIVIISCDVITDLDLKKMVIDHRQKDSGLTMLVTHYDTSDVLPPPGMKPPKVDPDLFMESVAHDVVVDSLASGEYDEKIFIAPNIQALGSILITSDKIDAHLYIIKRKLLKEYVLSSTSPCREMKSFKSEVIPHLLHLQFDLSLRTQEYVDSCCSVPLPFVESTVKMERTVTGPTGDLDDCFNESVALCRSYYHEDICVRANTATNYWMCNLTLAEFFSRVLPNSRIRMNSTQKCEVAPKVKVKGQSLVGEGTSIGENTSITGSNVGPNVKMGKNCKIENSVLYGNIEIADETSLIDSVVCCTIDQPQCTVIRSIVATASALQTNTTIVDETLIETGLFIA